MINLCRHIMPSGLNCKSPAMRGSAFCYFHGRSIPPARKSASSSEGRIQIPEVLDSNGFSRALRQVLQGLADCRISTRRASILLYGLQMASGQASEFDSELPDFGLDALLDRPGVSEEEIASFANALYDKMTAGSHSRAKSQRSLGKPPEFPAGGVNCTRVTLNKLGTGR